VTAAGAVPGLPAYRDSLEHLADELRRLNLLIRLRLGTASLLNETAPQDQVARTVYISRAEVDQLLATEPAGTAGEDAGVQAELHRLTAEIDGRVQRSLADGVRLTLAALGRLLGLSTMELGAVVICLAPELRRQYDRLYAYLQDDLTRRRPSVELVLDLLCGTERQRWTARGMLADSAPLLRAGIVCPIEDPQSPSGSTGLARFLALDPRICQFLLGADTVDARHRTEALEWALSFALATADVTADPRPPTITTPLEER